jgi:hypothetical protein
MLFSCSSDEDTVKLLPAEANEINLLIEGKLYQFRINGNILSQENTFVSFQATEQTSGGSLLISFYGVDFSQNTTYSQSTTEFGIGFSYNTTLTIVNSYQFFSNPSSPDYNPSAKFQLVLEELNIQEAVESNSRLNKFVGSFKMDGLLVKSPTEKVNVKIEGTINYQN